MTARELWRRREALIKTVEDGIRVGLRRDGVQVPKDWVRERACNIVQGLLNLIGEMEEVSCERT